MSRFSSSRQRQLAVTRAWLVAVALGTVTGLSAGAPDPKAARFYEDALVRYQKKDYAGAVIQLKNALQIDKDQLAVQLLLGKALQADSDMVGAEVAFNEALRLGVDRAEVVVPLAQAMLAQGKHQQVLEQPKFMPQGLPRGIQMRLLLVRAAAYSDRGDVREAARAVEEARAIDPGAPDSWLAEIPFRIRSRQFPEAMAAANRAMALAPQNAEPIYLKGTILHAQAQVLAALDLYSQALKLQPSHGEALVARAGLLLDQGRLSEADKDLQRLKELAPSEPRAAYMRAVVAEKRGDATAAKAALADVIGLLDPVPMNFLRFRPQLLMLGGLAHNGLGNNEKAKPYLEAVLRHQPSSPVAKLLARIYLGETNIDKAIDVLTTYLKSAPNDAQAIQLVAAAHMQVGRHARATALLQDALKTQDDPQLRTALGISLMGSGKSEAAINELETVLRKAPGQTNAGVTLVGLYLKTNQAAKALASAEALVKRSPEQAGHHNLLGMARGHMGDERGARAAFEQALRLDPGFAAPRIHLARLDTASRAFDSAAARLNQVLLANDKHVDALLEMALLSERRGKPEEARRWLAKATDVAPAAEIKPLQALVDHHLRSGQPEAALEAVRRLVAKAPENLEVMLGFARVLMANNNMVKARTVLTDATRLANFDADMQTRIGEMQVQARDLSGAAYSLQKALNGDPGHLGALSLLAEVETRQGDLARAEQRAREVLAKHPRSAAGPLLLGDVAAARGQAASALESYRRAHAAEPTTRTLLRQFNALLTHKPADAPGLAESWLKSHARDSEVRTALADTYARTGNHQAARKHYEVLLGLQPNNAVTLNSLANVLLLQKDPGALKAAERAVAADPTNANAIDTLGWASFQAGQPDRALQLLRDARLRTPENLEVRLHLGVVLAAKGRTAEAREELDYVVKNGPADSPFVRDAAVRLQSLR